METPNWNRRVWRLAGPIMLSNVSVPLLGAVDTAVVGHLPGAHNIGAVAVGALLFSIIYWGFGFLRMGTTGLTAQALGSGDVDQARAYLLRGLVLAMILGSCILALQRPVAWAAFAIIEAGPNVEPLADSYFSIRVWGAPAALANYAILGWFIGIQNTRAALALQVAMNGLNIILDLWFVMGLGWGVEGVAWATLISEVSAAALGIWLVRRHAPAIGGKWRPALILDKDRLRRMIAINRDLFIRTLCLQAAFVLLTALGARMGDVILAANAVLLLFQTFMAYALDGFAHAVEALAGSAKGSRDRNQFRGVVKATSVWSLIFSGGFAIAYGVLGVILIDIVTDVPEVRQTARTYLPWAVVLPLLSVWSFQPDGIFIGTTRTVEMRNAMIVTLGVFVAATAVLFPLFGNHGLWLAFTIFMVARAVTLGLRYPAVERSIGEGDQV
jgi:MATE family multidrug resistance protein